MEITGTKTKLYQKDGLIRLKVNNKEYCYLLHIPPRDIDNELARLGDELSCHGLVGIGWRKLNIPGMTHCLQPGKDWIPSRVIGR